MKPPSHGAANGKDVNAELIKPRTALVDVLNPDTLRR
jgi:hypothetical protein